MQTVDGGRPCIVDHSFYRPAHGATCQVGGIDPTDIWIGVIVILRPNAMRVAAGGWRRRRRRIAAIRPAALSAALPRPAVHRIFLAGNHSLRIPIFHSYVRRIIDLSQSSDLLLHLRRVAQTNERAALSAAQRALVRLAMREDGFR